MHIPKGWIVGGSNPEDYECGVDSHVFHSGSRSGVVKSIKKDAKGFGTIMQNFFPKEFLGKRIKLSAFIETKEIKGWVGLWMRVDGPADKILGFDNMESRKLTSTMDWKEYEIVLDIPKESVNLAFGVLLFGEGQVWIDDLKFEEVSKEIPTTNLEQIPANQPKNLDFEN